MHYVKGHNRNGHWVQGHYRRNRSTTAPSGVGHTRVRRYQRSDGNFVRSHYRNRPADVAAASGLGGLLFFLILLVVIANV